MDNAIGTAAGEQDELVDDRAAAPTGSGLPPGAGFDDRKAPGAFRTIGEVAKALGIRQHVLRYWEEQFPMLTPVKRSGNRRYYRPVDVALIERIDRLVHHEGYTLRGARLALEPAQKKGKRALASIVEETVPAPEPSVATDASASKPSLDELLAIRAMLTAALAA